MLPIQRPVSVMVFDLGGWTGHNAYPWYAPRLRARLQQAVAVIKEHQPTILFLYHDVAGPLVLPLHGGGLIATLRRQKIYHYVYDGLFDTYLDAWLWDHLGACTLWPVITQHLYKSGDREGIAIDTMFGRLASICLDGEEYALRRSMMLSAWLGILPPRPTVGCIAGGPAVDTAAFVSIFGAGTIALPVKVDNSNQVFVWLFFSHYRRVRFLYDPRTLPDLPGRNVYLPAVSLEV